MLTCNLDHLLIIIRLCFLHYLIHDERRKKERERERMSTSHHPVAAAAAAMTEKIEQHRRCRFVLLRKKAILNNEYSKGIRVCLCVCA